MRLRPRTLNHSVTTSHACNRSWVRVQSKNCNVRLCPHRVSLEIGHRLLCACATILRRLSVFEILMQHFAAVLSAGRYRCSPAPPGVHDRRTGHGQRCRPGRQCDCARASQSRMHVRAPSAASPALFARRQGRQPARIIFGTGVPPVPPSKPPPGFVGTGAPPVPARPF